MRPQHLRFKKNAKGNVVITNGNHAIAVVAIEDLSIGQQKGRLQKAVTDCGYTLSRNVEKAIETVVTGG